MKEKKIICMACGRELDSEKNYIIFDPVDEKDIEHYICYSCINTIHADAVRQEAANSKAEASDNEAVKKLTEKSERTVFDQSYETQELMEKAFSSMMANVSENTPAILKKYLDKYIIGQDNAKKILSLAMYNHYKRALFDLTIKMGKIDPFSVDETPDELHKEAIIMPGPTASGKTYMLRLLARKLKLPFTIVDSSCITSTGYVGSSVDTCISNLLQVCNDPVMTQYGVVFFDEFDKLVANRSEDKFYGAGPGGSKVQHEMLKLIEGTTVNARIPNEQNRTIGLGEPTIPIETNNIMFVCGGAFDKIDRIIEKRVTNGSVGFVTTSSRDKNKVDVTGMDKCTRYNTLIDHVTADDFMKYGVATELIGRLPIICRLYQLTEDELYRILVEPKNAVLKQYRAQASILDLVYIDIDDEALHLIAKKALELGVGARGLRTVLEEKLFNSMYNAIEEAGNIKDKVEEDKVVVIKVTKDCFESDAEPSIVIDSYKERAKAWKGKNKQ